VPGTTPVAAIAANKDSLQKINFKGNFPFKIILKSSPKFILALVTHVEYFRSHNFPHPLKNPFVFRPGPSDLGENSSVR